MLLTLNPGGAMKFTPVLVEQGTEFAGNGYFPIIVILLGAIPNQRTSSPIVHAALTLLRCI
jgi:hypothetical protein